LSADPAKFPVPSEVPPANGPPAPRPRRRTTSSEPMANRATRGFAWLMVQTVATKAVGFGAEIYLAKLLLTSDYGVRSNVMSVFLFANVLQEAGINHVLINRQHKLARWANAAFWASIAIAMVAGLTLAVIAPMVARAYHTPELAGMLLILALRSPINAISAVSYAKLQIQLRYKALAVSGFIVVSITALSSIVLAKLGFHAYSFVWPLLIAAIARSAILCWVAPVAIKWQLQFRRWKYLTTQSGLSLLATFFLMITSQGDFMALGSLFSTPAGKAAVVGIYYFAFNLCLQTTQFLTTNLANVLLPTFGKLQYEPERLKSAFLRATKLLAIFGVFVCLLQAAIAAPMIQTLFRNKENPDKWVSAVPVLQVISLAMAMQLFNMPAMSLIQAQGRFRMMLRLSVVFAIAFMAIIISCAYVGTGTTGTIRFDGLRRFLEMIFRQPVPLNVSIVVALGVALYNSVIGPICLYVAIRPIGGTWRDIWPIYLWPLITSGFAIFIGMAVGHMLPKSLPGNWMKLILVPTVSVLVYAPLVRLTAAGAWHDFVARLRGLWRPTAV
jgi:O-antigen/teichoic acid export membrane protein